jgi:hypothetical protein
MTVRLDTIFTINYGDHKLSAKDKLDDGNTLVVSSQGVDNGCYGFFDVKMKHTNPVISVPRTGSIGEAFVQLHSCNIDDNCLVLTPKKILTTEYLFYISQIIRLEKWRYMYGRQITPRRLGKTQVISDLDFKVELSFNKFAKSITPIKKLVKKNEYDNEPRLKKIQITELFDLVRGHFHAIDRLKKGKYPTISRVSTDNGLVGFYDKPKKAKIFQPYLITVSTVAGDAFLQYSPFIATDNVVICIPKTVLKVTTLMYIQAEINKVKWRYSYGRQCYKGTLQKTMLFLPVDSNGKIDENFIETMITSQPYWDSFKEKILN